MKNIKLGGSFFCPRCQCIHSSAFTCEEIQGMKKRQQEFFDNFRETTEEEKAMQTQPLFTLTAEEVEIVRFALAKRQYQLGNLLTSWEKEGVDEYDKEFEYYRDQYNKEEPILTRIKQWQDENNN